MIDWIKKYGFTAFLYLCALFVAAIVLTYEIRYWIDGDLDWDSFMLTLMAIASTNLFLMLIGIGQANLPQKTKPVPIRFNRAKHKFALLENGDVVSVNDSKGVPHKVFYDRKTGEYDIELPHYDDDGMVFCMVKERVVRFGEDIDDL